MVRKLTINWILEKLYFIYLVLVLCFAGSTMLKMVSLGVLAAMCCLRALISVKRGLVKFEWFSTWYAVFVLYALASCLWCSSLSRSKAVMYELVTSLLFILTVAANVKNRKNLDEYLKDYLLAVLLMSLMLIVGCRFNIGLIRNKGTDIIGLDKNYFSQIAAFASIIAVFYVHQTKRWSYLIYLPFYIAIILGSGSRKAILGIAMGLILMYAFVYRKSAKRFLKFLLLAVVTAVVVIGYVSYAKPEVIHRIVSGLTAFLGRETQGTDTSAQIRIELFARAMEIFRKNPLLGVGLNNFSNFSADINIYGGYMYAHNNYVELLADFGLIGFLIYYVNSVIYFLRMWRQRNKSEFNWFCALALALIVMSLVNDIASVSYYLKMYPFIIFVGFRMVTLKAEEHEEKKQ